jgi:hypothetical protein
VVEAFDIALKKEENNAFKVMISPTGGG